MQTNQPHNLVRLLRREKYVCLWWLAYTFDNPLRGLLHQPAKILEGLVGQGNKAIDRRFGIGFFSMGMARIIGAEGHVLAIDRQQRMLTILPVSEPGMHRLRHASHLSAVQQNTCQLPVR